MTIYNDAGCYGNDSTVQAALTAVDNGMIMYILHSTCYLGIDLGICTWVCIIYSVCVIKIYLCSVLMGFSLPATCTCIFIN